MSPSFATSFSKKRGEYHRGGMNMNKKAILPILGVGMVAGAALSMSLKPKEQAMIKQKAGQAARFVGDAMENISDAMHTD